MSEKNKKCILILPYFGKFNNYFELFLKSCALNPGYNWLIFTDCKDEYNYPKNVCVVKMTLEELHKRANEKLGFEVSLDAPYKLCDYKPASVSYTHLDVYKRQHHAHRLLHRCVRCMGMIRNMQVRLML